MEGFLHYRIGGPIFGKAYTWRGLFSEFYGNQTMQILHPATCTNSCKNDKTLRQKTGLLYHKSYLPCNARWSALLELMENITAWPKQMTVITHSVIKFVVQGCH